MARNFLIFNYFLYFALAIVALSFGGCATNKHEKAAFDAQLEMAKAAKIAQAQQLSRPLVDVRISDDGKLKQLTVGRQNLGNVSVPQIRAPRSGWEKFNDGFFKTLQVALPFAGMYFQQQGTADVVTAVGRAVSSVSGPTTTTNYSGTYVDGGSTYAGGDWQTLGDGSAFGDLSIDQSHTDTSQHSRIGDGSAGGDWVTDTSSTIDNGSAGNDLFGDRANNSGQMGDGSFSPDSSDQSDNSVQTDSTHDPVLVNPVVIQTPSQQGP